MYLVVVLGGVVVVGPPPLPPDGRASKSRIRGLNIRKKIDFVLATLEIKVILFLVYFCLFAIQYTIDNI